MIHVDIDRTWKILKCLERDDVKLRQASRYYGIPAKILKGRQNSGDLATKKAYMRKLGLHKNLLE